jgi:hypothetical protein
MIPAKLAILTRTLIAIHNDHIVVLDEAAVRTQLIDSLVHMAIFGDVEIKPAARWLIWEIAQELGIRPSSIHSLYIARGRRAITDAFTVPAMNFRGMVYDTATALFATAVATHTGAFICELARGEMGYSDQSPGEYVTSILAGAIKSGYVGPVFIQGDHFQAKCSATPGVPEKGDQRCVRCGFL